MYPHALDSLQSPSLTELIVRPLSAVTILTLHLKSPIDSDPTIERLVISPIRFAGHSRSRQVLNQLVFRSIDIPSVWCSTCDLCCNSTVVRPSVSWVSSAGREFVVAVA